MRSGGASGQGAGFARGLGPDGAFSAGAARPNQAVPGAPSAGMRGAEGMGAAAPRAPGGFPAEERPEGSRWWWQWGAVGLTSGAPSPYHCCRAAAGGSGSRCWSFRC